MSDNTKVWVFIARKWLA